MEEKLEVQLERKQSPDDVRAQSRQKLLGQVKQLKQLKLRDAEPKERMDLFRKINEEFKLYIQMYQERKQALEQLPKGRGKSEDLAKMGSILAYCTARILSMARNFGHALDHNHMR